GAQADGSGRVSVSAPLLVAQIGFEDRLILGRERSRRRPLVAAGAAPDPAPVRILRLVMGTRSGGGHQGGCQQRERKADCVSRASKPQDHDAVSTMGMERCQRRNSRCSMAIGLPPTESY